MVAHGGSACAVTCFKRCVYGACGATAWQSTCTHGLETSYNYRLRCACVSCCGAPSMAVKLSAILRRGLNPYATPTLMLRPAHVSLSPPPIYTAHVPLWFHQDGDPRTTLRQLSHLQAAGGQGMRYARLHRACAHTWNTQSHHQILPVRMPFLTDKLIGEHMHANVQGMYIMPGCQLSGWKNSVAPTAC